jgi:hypothetical protein
MRLWSLSPSYLDARGLVAVWREALLAQAVLRGRTRGYRQHPQLIRFRAAGLPLAAICDYLRAIDDEARARGYAFRSSRIGRARGSPPLTVTTGQLAYEWQRLLDKLARRDPEQHRAVRRLAAPAPHRLFRVVPGGVESWERPAV